MALRERLSIYINARSALVMLGVLIALSVLGPNDTYTRYGLGMRFVYWAGSLLGGWMIWTGCALLLGLLSTEQAPNRTMLIIVTLFAVPLISVWAMSYDAFIWRAAMEVDDIWRYGLSVLVISVSITFVINLVMGAAAPAHDGSSQGGERFLARLDPAHRRSLLYLEMQDHYVRVVSRAGSQLLLMRFSDAVSELEGVGLRVHRSWWVAFASGAVLQKDATRWFLHVGNAQKIPIARNRLAEARRAFSAIELPQP